MMKRGFTLIELLISITIFGLLSAFIVVNYSGNEKARLLKNQAQLIVSGLERAQNMSLTGEPTADGVTPLAYRFSISNCSDNCFYQINAVINAEEIRLVTKNNLNNAAISTKKNQDLVVTFNLPRSKIVLDSGNSSDWIEVSNGSNYYCVIITAISGRLDLKNGQCNNI